MTEYVQIFTDGGARGNPGPAGAAYIIKDASGNIIGGKGAFMSNATNNVAEYAGLVGGLKAAVEMGCKKIDAFSDSELMVKQINGIYRVKSPNLKELYAKCMALLDNFESWKITHVRRENNTDADELANRAMDAKGYVDAKVSGAGATAATNQKKLRIGVLLSGGGTTMVNIQKCIEAGTLNAEIVCVISSLSTVRGVELAKGIGIEPAIIRKKDHPDITKFSNCIAKVLDEAKVDLVVQAGWLCLWNIPDNYENRVINIHPALLPAFGGQGMWGHHVHEAVIAHGCKVSGCTVHFCTNEYDKGPIIVQRSCEVKDDDDGDILAARVFEQECLAYPEAIRLFAEDRLVVTDNVVMKK